MGNHSGVGHHPAPARETVRRDMAYEPTLLDGIFWGTIEMLRERYLLPAKP